MHLRIDLLGPMRGWSGDRELDLGPVRQQALLAVLVLRANQVVTVDELLDAVWGDRLPASGVKIIPPYIYRARKLIPDRIERTRDGYVFCLAPDALDLTRFESAVEDGRRARDRGDLELAVSLLAKALAEYRGEPLVGIPGPGLVTTRHRLTERRLQILAERISLDIECGRHADALPDLAALVEEHPLNERFAGLKMLALHRSGRQADALETYLKTRTILVEQLGVEPGQELREVHQSVLDTGSTAMPRDELPRDVADFVGRDAELAALCDHLRDGANPVVVIDGMAGVGKTALAVRAARRLADAYPDGRLFLDLHGHTPDQQPARPTAALDRLLRTIGVSADRIPAEVDERAALWRAKLAERRLLVVLDNAATSQQVQPLLPGSPTCGVLITSRRQLTGLDPAHRVALDILSPLEATSLLLAIIGSGETDGARQLVEACGQLPLAIRIAGARLRHRTSWTIDDLNQRLAEPDSRIAELAAEDGGVGQAFDLSYSHLPVDHQRMFRLLGLMPGPGIDIRAAAALGASSLAEADHVLDALVDANLLLTPTPDRFALHDLLREYAKLCAEADPPSVRDAALTRVHTWYLQSAANAKRAMGAPLRAFDAGGLVSGADLATFKDNTQALDWFNCERFALLSVVRDAARRGQHVMAYQTALMMMTYLTHEYLGDDLQVILRIATDSAQHTGDTVALGTCANHWGLVSIQFMGDNEGAIAHFEHAVQLFDEAGDNLGLSFALGNLGHALNSAGRTDEAVVRCRQSVELAHRLGNLDSEARNLNSLALAYIDSGCYDEATDASRQAAEIHRTRGNKRSLPYPLETLGRALAGRGDYHEAIDQYNEALTIFTQTGNRWLTCITLTNLGRAQHAGGLLDDARASWQQALQIYDELDATDTTELHRSDLVDLLATVS